MIREKVEGGEGRQIEGKREETKKRKREREKERAI